MATLRSTGTALYNNIWFMNVILLVRSVSQNVIMSNKRSLGIKLADVQRFLDTVGLTALFMMIVYWLFDILAIVAGKIDRIDTIEVFADLGCGRDVFLKLTVFVI